MSISNKYKFQIYLLFIVLIGYWPFSFFLNSLINDNIDVALATKYFAGTCLQNGQLPLWNPYQIFGFPAHADLQYTNWSLEVLLIGIIKGYDYYVLHILFLSYLYIGALGMFLLSKFLSKNAITSFYLGCVYILSGLFSAHAQSLVAILGLVWMPYVILHFFKWLESPSLKTSILLSIFSYLAFTLGYQAFSFMLIPLFIGLFVIKTYDIYKNKSQQIIKHYFFWGLITVLFISLLLSPVIVTQFQSKYFVERLNGLTADEVMANPFSPWGFVSLLNPILTIGNDDLFNTEITMRNIFMGIIPLILFITSLFKKEKSKTELFLLFIGLLFMLASFGDIIPVRRLLYYTIPGFKLFRFPATLRIASILCFLIYLIPNLKSSINLLYLKTKHRNLLILFFISLSLCITLFSWIKCTNFSFLEIKDSFNQKIIQSSPYEIAFYYGVIQTSLLLLTLFLLNEKSLKVFYKRLFAITLIELVFTITIYGQYVTFGDTKPSIIQENFSKLSAAFPEPSIDPQVLNTIKYDYIHTFWKNTGCFKKQAIPYDEWTSYLFKNYNQLQDYYPVLKDSLYSYPFIYFSKPNQIEKLIDSKPDTTLQSIITTFHKKNSEASYYYRSYSPDNIIINYETAENLILNLQQAYYTGWKALLDGKEISMVWNTSLLMSVPIPAGKHEIQFKYNNPAFKYSLLISLTVIACLLIILILNSQNSKFQKTINAGFFILFLSIILSTFMNASKKPKQTESTFIFQGNKKISLKLQNKNDISNLWYLINQNKKADIVYQWTNFYNSPELLHSLKINPEDKTYKSLSGKNTIHFKDQLPIKVLFIESYQNYTTKQFIDTSSHSLILEGKSNPYSIARVLDLNQLSHKNIYGTLEIMTKENSNPYTACSIKTKSGKEIQKYFALNKYLIPNGKFQSIPYYFNLSTVKEDIEEIKLFLMNQNDNKVYIKSFDAGHY